MNVRRLSLLICAGAMAAVCLFLGNSWYAVVLAIAGVSGTVLVWRTNCSSWLGSLVFLLPIVCTVGWTAPRGDDDGLWLLWFPTALMLLPAMTILVLFLKMLSRNGRHR